MAERGAYERRTETAPKVAVAYLRSQLQQYREGLSIASTLQRRAIGEYGEVHGYKIVEMFCDPYRDRYGMADNLPELEKAMLLCREHGAKLFYVSLARWRRNDVLKRRIAEFQRAGGRVSPIESDEVLRFLEKNFRMPRATAEKASRIVDRNVFQRDIEKVGAAMYDGETYSKRKIFNYIYLKGSGISEYIRDLMTKDLSDREIADELHLHALSTVDGRRWTKDTVRKTRNIITNEDFSKFLDVSSEISGAWASMWFLFEECVNKDILLGRKIDGELMKDVLAS